MKGLWKGFALSAAAYAALYVVLSYPLFRSPGSTLFHPIDPWGDADINLIIWILCWGWRAILGRAESLFDANIFHPAEQTFASSEHLLGYAPLFGPIYEISANPVLANQVMVLLSFATSGAGMYALLRHWRVPVAAAFFGGFVHAFFPSRFGALGEPQLLATGFLPLAFVYLDDTVMNGRLRSAVGLAVFFCWQTLCSVYLAFMAVLGLATYGAASALRAPGNLKLPGIAAAAVALAIVGLALLTLHRPYSTLRESGVIPEYGNVGRIGVYSNGWIENHVTHPSSVRSGEKKLESGRLLYLGVLPTIAALGLLLARRREEPRWAAASALAVAGAGYLIGLGPVAEIGGRTISLPYAYLADLVPGFSSMRVPSRFGFLFMCGFAAISALGGARILERWSNASKWKAGAVAAAAIGLTVVDYDLRNAYLVTRSVASLPDTIPAVYRKLAELPRGPVLEVPIRHNIMFRDRRASFEMFHSTFHWHPLLNGYSGYAPPSFDLVQAVAARLPEPDALLRLCRMTGLRYVISGFDRTPSEWLAPPGLTEIGRFDDKTLFELATPCRPDRVDLLRQAPPWTETVDGTPIRQIAEPAAVGFRFPNPPPTTAKKHRGFRLEVEVVNRSDEIWPALAPAGSPVVALGYRWESKDGSVIWPLREDHPRAATFPEDIQPGATIRVQLPIKAPVRSGPSWLVVGLSQGETWIVTKPGRSRIQIQ